MVQIQHMSKAFALRCVGTVYLIVQDGREPNPTSTWVNWEAGTLTRTGKVDKIIRVELPSKVETPIWEKGSAPLYNPAPPGKV